MKITFAPACARAVGTPEMEIQVRARMDVTDLLDTLATLYPHAAALFSPTRGGAQRLRIVRDRHLLQADTRLGDADHILIDLDGPSAEHRTD